MPSPGDPQSLNRYAYVQNNPLKYVDPTGHIEQEQDSEAQAIVRELQRYGFEILVDWRLEAGFWNPGLWDIKELQIVREAARDLVDVFSGRPIEGQVINVWRVDETGQSTNIEDTIKIKNGFAATALPKAAFVHEFAHAWDYFNGGKFKNELPGFRRSEPGPTAYGSGTGWGTWASHPDAEEWAESLASYVYPNYINYLNTVERERKWAQTLPRPYNGTRPGLGPRHEIYVALRVQGKPLPHLTPR